MIKLLRAGLLLAGLLVPDLVLAQQPGPNLDVLAPNPLIGLTNAGAGTTDSADQVNNLGKGVILGLNTTVNSGTISVVVSIRGKDVISGQYYAICTSAALAATAFTTLSTYPGQTTQANIACSAPLPRTWQVHVVSGVGASPNFNLTVGASVIH